jgi:hypothetical protein
MKVSFVDIHELSVNKNFTHSLILKNVDTQYIQNELVNVIKDQYASCCEVTRFTKDNKNIPVIKVDMSSNVDYKSALENGIFIHNCFILPEPFIKLKEPTRCYHCQRFGHVSRDCASKAVVCCRCGGDHNNKESNCNQPIKCTNCGEGHFSSSRLCNKYVMKLNKMNVIQNPPATGQASSS